MPSTIYSVLIADVLESRARRIFAACSEESLLPSSKRHLRKRLIQLPYSVTCRDEFQTVTRDLPSIPAVILDLRGRCGLCRSASVSASAAFPTRIQPAGEQAWRRSLSTRPRGHRKHKDQQPLQIRRFNRL